MIRRRGDRNRVRGDASVGGSAPLATRIDELRRLMVDAKDLREISDHFDAALVSQDAFMDAGEPATNERLVSIARMAVKVAVKDAEVVEAMLLHLAEYSLWHGALVLHSPAQVQVVYFEDVNRGLCSVGQPPSRMWHHIRFSIPEQMTAPINPDTARLVHIWPRSVGTSQVESPSLGVGEGIRGLRHC